jgi:hypothetical protein
MNRKYECREGKDAHQERPGRHVGLKPGPQGFSCIVMCSKQNEALHEA